MTDQTSPAATYEISASASTGDRGAALTARVAISDVLARLGIDGGVDLTTSKPAAPGSQSYGETLAREIADELDRRADQRTAADQRMKNMLMGPPAADGWTDPNVPRMAPGQLYEEPDEHPTIWALLDDGTWRHLNMGDWIIGDAGDDAPDCDFEELHYLGAVQIPLPSRRTVVDAGDGITASVCGTGPISADARVALATLARATADGLDDEPVPLPARDASAAGDATEEPDGHEIEISHSGNRVHWACGTCQWVGANIGSEQAAHAEHARIAADIAAGRLALAEKTAGCHRCNGSGILPTHDGEDEPCSCTAAPDTAEGATDA